MYSLLLLVLHKFQDDLLGVTVSSPRAMESALIYHCQLDLVSCLSADGAYIIDRESFDVGTVKCNYGSFVRQPWSYIITFLIGGPQCHQPPMLVLDINAASEG